MDGVTVPITGDEASAPPVGKGADAFLLAYLAGHEAECPACGYNVHRLTEPRCPECGRRLALQIVSELGGYSVPWIVLLVLFGVAAGVGLLVWCVEIRMGFADLRHARPLTIVLAYFMANAPMPALVLALRRLFIRAPLAVQYAVMGLGGAATLGMLSWFVVLVHR